MDGWFVQSPSEFANTLHVLFTGRIPLKDLGSIPSGAPGYCMLTENSLIQAAQPSTHHPPAVATRSAGIFSRNCSSSSYFYH